MDANGTRYHLLLGYEDWAACTDEAQGVTLRALWEASPPQASDLEWDRTSNELRLQQRILNFAAAPLDVPPTLAARRGGGCDLFGNWYWIDESRRAILVHSSGDGRTTQYWPAGPDECALPARGAAFAPANPEPPADVLILSGLAVTTDHTLVVGTLEPAGLLLFDLHAGGPPQRLAWPEAIPFAPWDMAAMPGGGVWVLDRLNRRYWALDRALQPMRDEQATVAAATPDFASLDGTVATPPPAFPTGISLDAASPLELADPVAIEALPDCTVLILEAGSGDFARVHRYRFARRIGPPASTESVRELIEETAQSAFTLRPHDFAFVAAHSAEGAPVPDRLYIATAGGNQSFAFDIWLESEPLADVQPDDAPLRLRLVPDFLPMRLFGGKGIVTCAAGAAPAVYYDFGDRWIPLVAQRRPRYAFAGVAISPIFDGREPACVWHRLLFDGCLPPDASVTFYSRASDDRADLEEDRIAWQQEPAPLRRATGSELPWTRRPAAPHRGTWEALCQQARGRFAQIRIELSGNGRVTPQLHALRVWYPRFSYLDRYLPAVYRADPQSASFLDRFLANIEGMLTTLEDKIAAVQLLFDAASAPPETLDWLADWFGIALDPAWDEARRRLFIANAMTFFQWRGTPRGLILALRLTLDSEVDVSLFADDAPLALGRIRIVEKYLTRTVPAVALGDPTQVEIDPFALAPPEDRWAPAQGAATLHERYRRFAGEPDNAALEYPLTPPPAVAAWQQFSQAVLGFVPAAAQARLDLWQGFLQRRYARIDALNTAWGLAGAARFTSFAQAPRPTALPPDGAALVDWHQFETILLPMQRLAHRFSVLVPVTLCAFDETEDDRRRRLDLARRVVALQKPAHTIFDVRSFFALFQVGSARLGDDTLLDQGSRAPELLRAFVLGRDHLVEGYLA